MKEHFRLLLFILCMLAVPMSLSAQERERTRMWLFGVERSNLYDSYLSPLDYRGHGASLTMMAERAARWCPKVVIDSCDFILQPRVTTYYYFDVAGTEATNATGNAHFYDAQTTFAAGWHANWLLHPRIGQRLRLRAGGLAEFSGGGTYSTRNGNNPAQGRAAIDLAASGIADFYFHSPFKRQKAPWVLRAELSLPLLGTMFSPQYGQSYYELFSLGHYDHNVRPTCPVNAPSARFFANVEVPVGKARVLVGYRGEALQSRVNGLKHHAWNNGFFIGFTRHLKY